MTPIGAFAAAYLVGTLSWSYLAVRAKGLGDLRHHGSGNLGATNAGRVLGRRWAVAIYVLDMLKGLGPVLLAAALDDGDTPPLALAAGLGVILGHVFPFWLGFRGGKGVATGSGVILGLSPLIALAGIGVWALVFLATRLVSVASIAAAAALPLIAALLLPGGAAFWWYEAFFIAIGALVVVMHRSNIRRLLAGTET